MFRICVMLLASGLVSGCTRHERFDVDLARVSGFDWNGHVEVTQHYFGIFDGWETTAVRLRGEDGRHIDIEVHGRCWPNVVLKAETLDTTPQPVEVRRRPTGIGVLVHTGTKRQSNLIWRE